MQSACDAHRWRYCFIGGLAVLRWGEPRETVDVDLTLLTGFSNEASYVDVLLEHFEPRRADAAAFVRKLRPNIPLDAARSELQGVYGRIAEEFPLPLRHGRILRVQLLQDKIVGPTEVALTLLMAAVGFVLLIATTNIAHLLTARALMRRSEIAIRTALGASHARIVRQLVSENALIAAGGCIIGLLVAKVVLEGITVAWPDAVPRLQEATLNAPVLAFGVSVALISTFLFGVAPAMALLRTEVTSTLKSSDRSLSPTRGARRMRGVLVALSWPLPPRY